MMPITSAKVIGTPTETGWVQVHDFTPDSPEKKLKRGHIFALICKDGRSLMPQENSLGYVREAREILTRLHEEYYGNLVDDAFIQLKRAIEKVIGEWSDGQSSVSIGALVFFDDVVYAAIGGNISLFLSREGAFIPLIQNPQEGVLAMSGELKPEDSFILATKQFQELIPSGVFKAGVAGGNLAAFAESVAPLIYAQTDNCKTGVLLVMVAPTESRGQALFSSKKAFPTPQLPKVGQTGRHMLLKLTDTLLSLLPERSLTVRPEIVDMSRGRSRKKFIPLIGLFLVFLLIISIAVGIRARERRAFLAEFETELNQAEHEFTEAQTLIALNPERARELALSARKRATSLKDKGITESKLMDFLMLLSEKMGTITGVYEVNPELYLDLTLVSSGFIGTDMAYSEGYLAILDANAKKLIGIELPTKRTSILAGPDFLLSPKSLFQYTDKSFVLSADGVRRVDDEVELVVKTDWDTNKRLLGAFAGNIYILDKEENTIWRYPAAGSGYAEKSSWLASGIQPDFSGAQDWAIDGTIWVYATDGGLKRFSQGVPQAFSTSSYLSLSGMSDFFTNEEAKNLYFLDAAHSKIIVVTKEGVYKAEYVSDAIKEAVKIIVSEQEKKIILLTGEKLFSLPIKHL